MGLQALHQCGAPVLPSTDTDCRSSGCHAGEVPHHTCCSGTTTNLSTHVHALMCVMVSFEGISGSDNLVLRFLLTHSRRFPVQYNSLLLLLNPEYVSGRDVLENVPAVVGKKQEYTLHKSPVHSGHTHTNTHTFHSHTLQSP